jgi:hypothetical protein
MDRLARRQAFLPVLFVATQDRLSVEKKRKQAESYGSGTRYRISVAGIDGPKLRILKRGREHDGMSASGLKSVKPRHSQPSNSIQTSEQSG